MKRLKLPEFDSLDLMKWAICINQNARWIARADPEVAANYPEDVDNTATYIKQLQIHYVQNNPILEECALRGFHW